MCPPLPPAPLQSHHLEVRVAETSEVPCLLLRLGGSGPPLSTARPGGPPHPGVQPVGPCFAGQWVCGGLGRARLLSAAALRLCPGLGASPTRGPGSVPAAPQSSPTAPGLCGHLSVQTGQPAGPPWCRACPGPAEWLAPPAPCSGHRGREASATWRPQVAKCALQQPRACLLSGLGRPRASQSSRPRVRASPTWAAVGPAVRSGRKGVVGVEEKAGRDGQGTPGWGCW